MTYSDGQSTQTSQVNPNESLSKIIVLVLVIFGFITSFAGGYFMSQLISSGTDTAPRVSPTPDIRQSVTKPPESSPAPIAGGIDVTRFIPGKPYFDDTVIAVTKDAPRINLVATVTRIGQDSGYSQDTRVSFFDGNTWTRKSSAIVTKDSGIYPNDLVKYWNSVIDPSRVLKQSAQGEITVNTMSVSFSTGLLQNEIGMRSIPGYTKFLSNGTGTITVNGKTHPAYLLYTRIYSLNSADIQFYDQPFGLTTDWIAFWDSAGNFYHVDATSVDKPTPLYQTHRIGVMENPAGSVTKTFDIAVKRDSQNPPARYSVTLNGIQGLTTLSFDRINSINKAPDGSYAWYMGAVEGTAETSGGTKLDGIGLVEYIHD